MSMGIDDESSIESSDLRDYCTYDDYIDGIFFIPYSGVSRARS